MVALLCYSAGGSPSVCPCVLHLPLAALILSVVPPLSVAPALCVSPSSTPPLSVSGSPSLVLLSLSSLAPLYPSAVSSPPHVSRLLSCAPPLSSAAPEEPGDASPALRFPSGNSPSVCLHMKLTDRIRNACLMFLTQNQKWLFVQFFQNFVDIFLIFVA